MAEIGMYKHFKGNLYQVLAVAEHTETGERMVIYKQIAEHNCQTNKKVWARPEYMFDGTVNGQPRFKRV